MRNDDLFGVGIVADDIEATTEGTAATCGHRWAPFRISFSQAVGDVHLEPLQSTPVTTYVPAGPGIRHLGYRSDDVDQDLAPLHVPITRSCSIIDCDSSS